ncbi:expressed protein [Echinococcus multilocularis]|uniref:Expressed protein n=1 Tax=Echinococcus multilocularis TaxID=6211 RepID=A0A068YC08_ECHMU|nr:expressed protein [Echinococcus multilocularis]
MLSNCSTPCTRGSTQALITEGHHDNMHKCYQKFTPTVVPRVRNQLNYDTAHIKGHKSEVKSLTRLRAESSVDPEDGGGRRVK